MQIYIKQIALFIFSLFLLNGQAFGQMTVSNAMTPQQFVQNVLVGVGVTVSNVTYSAGTNAMGTFTTGTTPTNVGFSTGVIMSTGSVFDAPGPNTATGVSTNLGMGSDPQLAALLGTTYTVNDATVLEFDFIPESDTIRFRYVFGSDEYPEFVSSSFNDVFGFFVSGLNPSGGFYTHKNIALIPGTNLPVTIDNVNNVTPSYAQYYVDNTSGLTIEYDGFTTVLTAWLAVVPCLSYHIKLAVGDAGDHIYDSAVFLEENSFSSWGVTVQTNFSQSGIDTMAVEGCNDAIMTFTLPDTAVVPYTIYYGITGSATNGVDYLTIPSQVTVPADSISVSLTISPFLDTITEGIEQVTLLVATSVCSYDTFHVFIKDNTPVETIVSSDTVLCGGSVDLFSIPSGGIAPYFYQWSTGDTLDTVTVYPNQTTIYQVLTSDICGYTDTSEIEVKVSIPIITTINDTICIGDTAHLQAFAPGATYLWGNSTIGPDLYFFPPVTTTIQVVATDTLGCIDSSSATAFVNPLPIINISSDTTICDGNMVDILADGGEVYMWSTGETSPGIQVNPNSSTNYTVIVIDSNGCVNTNDANVSVIPLPYAELISPSDTICRGQYITLIAQGGDNYIWSTGSTQSTIEEQPFLTTEYSVIVYNSLNQVSCYDTATFELIVKRCNTYYIPNAFSPDGDGRNDEFGVLGVGLSNLEIYKMVIYNRWGQMVFSSSDPLNRWNGKVDNSSDFAPQGVYVYHLQIKEKFDDEQVFTGTIQLMK